MEESTNARSQGYKTRTTLSPNASLMLKVGEVLVSWRMSQRRSGNGSCAMTLNEVARAIHERYESVYRIENGGGSPAVLVKYLLFISRHDPSFDFMTELKKAYYGGIR